MTWAYSVPRYSFARHIDFSRVHRNGQSQTSLQKASYISTSKYSKKKSRSKEVILREVIYTLARSGSHPTEFTTLARKSPGVYYCVYCKFVNDQVTPDCSGIAVSVLP